MHIHVLIEDKNVGRFRSEMRIGGSFRDATQSVIGVVNKRIGRER
jgi:hypothetical protein